MVLTTALHSCPLQVPLATAVQREIARFQIKAGGNTQAADALSWTPTFYKFPHPALDAATLLGYVIGPFIFAACMFSFVAQAGVRLWLIFASSISRPACSPSWRKPVRLATEVFYSSLCFGY